MLRGRPTMMPWRGWPLLLSTEYIEALMAQPIKLMHHALRLDPRRPWSVGRSKSYFD